MSVSTQFPRKPSRPKGKKIITLEESILFIELVRMNESLYNSTATDYKDPMKAQSIWQNIAETMGRRDMDGAEWKKRWRNMRDMYVKKRRAIRTCKNPIIVERAKNWRFLCLMSFLDGHIDESYSIEDYGPSVDSDNADLSDANMSGDEGSASCSEKPIVMSLDMSCQPEIDTAALPMSAFATSTPHSHTNGTMRSGSSNSSRGQKRLHDGGDDHETEPTLLELIRNHKKNRDGFMSAHQKTVEQVFFDSCALRMEKLPHEMRSYLQFQISQLFFNAENPSRPPVPIIPLPPHETAQTVQTSAPLCQATKVEHIE